MILLILTKLSSDFNSSIILILNFTKVNFKFFKIKFLIPMHKLVNCYTMKISKESRMHYLLYKCK